MTKTKSSDIEQNLVRRAKEGDMEAFQSLHARYKKKVFNYLYRVSGNRHYAEDLTQDTFLVAYRCLKDQREDAKFRAWLFCIAASRFRASLRQQKRRPVTVHESQIRAQERDADVSFEAVDERGPRPDQEAHRKELQKKIQECIGKLPVRDRNVLLLCDVEGLSYAETAEALRLHPNSIGYFLSRARQRFRKFINLDEFDVKFFASYVDVRKVIRRWFHPVRYWAHSRYLLDAYVDDELSHVQSEQIRQLIQEYPHAQERIRLIETVKMILCLLMPLELSRTYNLTFAERLQNAQAQEASLGRTSWADRWEQWSSDLRSHIWLAPNARLGLGLASCLILLLTIPVMIQNIGGVQPEFHYQGHVLGYAHEQNEWIPMVHQKQVQRGAQLQVAQASFAQFSLKDLYGVKLMEGSRIKIHDLIRDQADNRIHLELTEGRLLVKTGKDFGTKELRIQVEDYHILALGTMFTVEKGPRDGFFVELLAGQLHIQAPGQVFTLQSYEYFRLTDDGRKEQGDIGFHRIDTLREEMNAISPVIPIEPYVIKDLSSELTLTQTSHRARQALSQLGINFLGDDKDRMLATIDAFQVTRDTVKREAFLQSIEKALAAHKVKEVASHVFLFLAVHALQEDDVFGSIELLKKVIQCNHPEWTSMAQCMIALIYEEKLNDYDRARNAYQELLEQYPQSLEAKEATQAITRLKRR